MSEWMAIAQWHECEKMTRPGMVFELRNAEGQTMLSPCVAQVPAKPFDWKSAPVMFRVVDAPGRSAPRRCRRQRLRFSFGRRQEAPDESVNRVMSLMTRHRVRHMPVLSGGRLVGIISIGDVAKQRLDDLELETHVLLDHNFETMPGQRAAS